MSHDAIPPDLCWEIALLSTPKVVASLISLCKANRATLLPLLYRDVYVGEGANHLIVTLQHHQDLALGVRSLEFAKNVSVTLNRRAWAFVLTQMNNLRRLVVSRHVPLDWDVIPRLSFRLHSFTALSSVIGPWATFVTNQRELREFACDGDFFASAPRRDKLPWLRRLKARPEDIGKFSRVHALEHVWFWAPPPLDKHGLGERDLLRFADSRTRLQSIRLGPGQLMQLLNHAPQMLATVRAVVLEEEITWYAFTFDTSRGVLLTCTAALHRMPAIESLQLVCSLSPTKVTRPIELEHAVIFSGALLGACTAPMLRTFHFCAVDGCATWTDWGHDGEQLSFSVRDEQCPASHFTGSG
ncbi:hypothetical protein B0H15DRAFT_958206 [Mycena belliarum]|uniref:Uncharacterized protein n=1 Tax=Mycena belliarum TaxID=1033014 RepID=A0AAD6TNC5_9AGAR|nr:hypothetical protein B0H15DRAFT_958206 [Mycena belliae]